MCYDISFTVDIKQLSDYFPDMVFDDQIKIDFDLSAHILGHAYGLHPVIYKNRDDALTHCRLAEWGCIPFFIKEKAAYIKQRAGMLNAKAERILTDTTSYWHKIRNRRCLIPVSGFYEHRKLAGFTKKIPYLIQLKRQPMFFLPGLYSVVNLPDADGVIQETWTYTIITRPANKVMSQIHNDGENPNRMPLMLTGELSDRWIKADLSIEDYQHILNYEMPNEELKWTTVYTIRTSKERPDNKRKDELFDWGTKVPEIAF